MKSGSKSWVWGVGAIGLIWVIAAAGVWMARTQTPTAEKIIAYVDAHPIETLTGAERQEVIDGLADRVNRLPFAERQKMRMTGSVERFYRNMTPEERSDYLDRTLSKGMRQLMLAFNEMSRDERQRIVDEAMLDMQRFREEVQAGRAPDRDGLEQENAEKFVNEGLRAYLSEANAETKLDLQPLVEQMQMIMQESRRR